MHSGGRLRMASISEGFPTVGKRSKKRLSSDDPRQETRMDASKEHPGEHDYQREEAIQYHRRPSEALFTDVEEKENPFA